MNHQDPRPTWRISRRTLLTASIASALPIAAQAPAKRKTLMCIGAHMDDSEWMAGGLMFKAVQDGLRVVIVQAVSDWSNWPPSQGREKKVEAGVVRIAREIGAEKILLGYKYHYTPVDMDLKMRLAHIVEKVQPDIAVVMSETDYWTDHTNIARAGKDALMFVHGYLARAFKGPSVILAGCAGFNQTYDFKPDTFVDVTSVIEKVGKLITDLDDLLLDKPSYATELTLTGPAAGGFPKTMRLSSAAEKVLAARSVWGEISGARFAEGFRTIRRTTQALW